MAELTGEKVLLLPKEAYKGEGGVFTSSEVLRRLSDGTWELWNGGFLVRGLDEYESLFVESAYQQGKQRE